jgi:Bacterial sugar transferase
MTLKFRTMTGARNTDGKSPDKQRITTFGKILRRTSLKIGSVSLRGIRKVNSLVLLGFTSWLAGFLRPYESRHSLGF